jgi:hypothetical protein
MSQTTVVGDKTSPAPESNRMDAAQRSRAFGEKGIRLAMSSARPNTSVDGIVYTMTELISAAAQDGIEEIRLFQEGYLESLRMNVVGRCKYHVMQLHIRPIAARTASMLAQALRIMVNSQLTERTEHPELGPCDFAVTQQPTTEGRTAKVKIWISHNAEHLPILIELSYLRT